MVSNNRIYKVMIVESKTGIILNDKFEPHYGEDGFCLIFNNLEEAKKHIINNLKPGVEYSIYNSLGEIVYEYIYNEVIRVEYRELKGKWWQFWK